MRSGFPFGRERYGSAPTPASPYQRAAQVWDDRMGSALAQARAWRWAAFLGLTLSIVLAAGLIWTVGRPRIRTYVVPVSDAGRPGRIEAPDRVYDPTAAETAFFVSQWLKDVRSRSVDAVVVRDNWLQAYRVSSGDARLALDALARANDPTAGVGQSAVAVDVVSALSRSSQTVQLAWRETRYERGGRSTVSRWTGLFTTSVVPPKDEAELRLTPLGLRLTSFQWSREL